MAVEAFAGILAGVLAWYVIPDTRGIAADTLLGLIGGGLAAFIYKLFGHRLPFEGWSPESLTAAVFGALLLIGFTRMATGRRIVG